VAQQLHLERFSPRALNLLGSVVHGQEARVVLSRRLVPAAAVVLESRTLFLDPDRTNVYDLLLGARLLRRRPDGRGATGVRDRLPSRLRRRWVREARASLARDYPGVLRLPGRFLPGAPSRDLRVSWQSVSWKPLDPNDPDALRGGTIEHVPGVDGTGNEDDFTWLAAAVRSGRFPLEHLPDLGELPVATVPLSLPFSPAYGPRVERLEELIAENREVMAGLMQCYQRKSEVNLDLIPLGERKLSGTRLDSSRLVEAVLARRVGLEPKLFLKRREVSQPVFDPRQHCVVLGIDLNDLRRGPIGDPSFSHRILAVIVKMYQTLGVDFAVLGFSDHVIDLGDGARAYLHVPVTLKGVDDPYDGTFWNRLAHVMDRPPSLPGEPACYHPLLMRSVARVFEEAGRDRRHSYRAVVLAAKRGMPAWSPEFHSDEFLTRTAAALDEEIDRLRERFAGTLDTTACFVPPGLKDRGRKGGAVAAMF
jgi:hypothetical protein